MRFLVAPLAVVVLATVTYAIVAIAPRTEAMSASERLSSQIVSLDGATRAQIELKLDAGQIWYAGGSMAAGRIVGSNELLRAEFSYPEGNEPEISYSLDETGSVGDLVISSPDSSSPWAWSTDEQRWRIFANPTVSTELDIEIGTGDAELVVGGMKLSNLEVASGSGNVTIDLTGDWRSGMKGTVEVGAGDITIRAPSDVGVKVTLEQGSGTVRGDGFTGGSNVYVNRAYGSTAIKIELTIEQGAGYVDLSEV